MPLQISPIPYRGDVYLNQGITSAGNSIGDGLESMMKRMKQTKAVRTMAVDGLGMDPDAVDKMSLEEVQGHLQGAAVKNAQAEANARRMMEEAHGDYYRRFNLKAANEDRFSDAVNQYLQPQPMGPGEQGPPATPKLDPQALMMLEAKAGTLDPDKAMQYMKQLGGGTENAGPVFFEDPTSHKRFAVRGNTMMDSGFNPAEMMNTLPTQNVTDAQGGVHTAVINPKTGTPTILKSISPGMTDADKSKLKRDYLRMHASLVSSKAQWAMDKNGKEDPELAAPYNEEIKKVENSMRELDQPAAPSGAAGQAVITKAAFKKGDRVKQNGVTYEFDGTNWSPAK